MLDVNLDNVEGGGDANQICEDVIVWGDEEEVGKRLRNRESDRVGDILHMDG